MRIIPIMVAVLALGACDLVETKKEKTAVDTASLAPLSSREQALIYGADGAAQQGNTAAAERDYLSAVALSSGRVDAHLALARLYDKQMEIDKERGILEAALALQPNHPLVNYLLGKLDLNASRYDAARHAFQQGRVTRPDDADLMIGEAVAQDMLGEHAAAQQLYQRLLRNRPRASLPIINTNLAMSYLLSNQPQKAVDLLQEEASQPNASPVSRHNLALAYGLLGKHDQAKAALKGEMDEETRLLAVARMKSYHRDRLANASTPPLTPSITEVAAPVEPVTRGPVPVVKHAASQKEPAKEAAKPVPAKPAATVAKKPEPVKPATAAAVAPAAAKKEPAAEMVEEKDPNYIPGVTEELEAQGE